jgi:hypothetical protein
MVPWYFALCCAKPAVTAALRSASNAEMAALLAAILPVVSGYSAFGADGVSVMNVCHGPTPPVATLFQ